MNAAVVESFGSPPRYRPFDLPPPRGPHDVVVEVLAAGLHPRVRSQADGSHYTSTGNFPLVPGVDGVGRLPDGSLVYFVLPDTRVGSMAERTILDLRRSVTLPDGTDVERVAAAMNPGMSSWVALRRRITLEPGQSVLVLGATGNAGRMAVEIARHLGAGHVLAAARDRAALDRLPALGADETVCLADDPADVMGRLGAAAAEVDVVLDYLWGTPAEQAIVALVTHRNDPAAALRWVQIGSVAGPTIALPSAALRAANLQVLGNGQGSVGMADLLAELPSLAATISAGTFAIDARAVPLREVEEAWAAPSDGSRIVLEPR